MRIKGKKSNQRKTARLQEKNMEKTLFYDLSDLFGDPDEVIAAAADCAEKNGISGNAVANYISYRLLTSENAFSLCAEKGLADKTISALALSDVKKVIAAYNRIKSYADEIFGGSVTDYRAGEEKNTYAANRIGRLGGALVKAGEKAENGDETAAAKEALAALKSEYLSGGAGLFGMADAFRLGDEGGEKYSLTAVPNFAPKIKGSIVGYEGQKKALWDNTDAFVRGQSCNNVLLYGDAGTGKSTSVKALIPDFRDYKLKIIEIYKHQYSAIAKLMSDIDGRGFRFILFLDDLSFEENETEYKYFKAILDGGLGNRPDNVVIYATSNRMHLIKETFSDRADISRDDIHRSDTVEEKISLSARFGLSLFYPAPDTKEYLAIVAALAEAEGIKMPPEKLDSLALRWATAQNKKSGRTATQFIDALKAGVEE